MTIRTAIAKWLAPEVFDTLNKSQKQEKFWSELAAELHSTALRRWDVLREISSQRTERCNATVRRICDMADKELSEGN